MKYLFNISNKTFCNLHEIHKMLNFPSICSGDWNICAEYDLRGRFYYVVYEELLSLSVSSIISLILC